MIIDSMTKFEVMNTLRKEFDEEVLPYYKKEIRPELKKSIFSQDCKENVSINFGEKEFVSSQNNTFRIIFKASKINEETMFYFKFRWRNKGTCYANFFRDKNVVVYQEHCLERYAERVLHEVMTPLDVFINHIIIKQKSSFNITLPTPTYPQSQYFGLADALFLGDFDLEHPKEKYLWLNTCISLNETHYSQSKILDSLWELQSFVSKNENDYADPKNTEELETYLKRYRFNAVKREELRKFLTQKYLLWKLHLSFNFDFTELFRDEIKEHLTHIEKYLKNLNVNYQSLTPFSKSHGIAWKGEIDYRG